MNNFGGMISGNMLAQQQAQQWQQPIFLYFEEMLEDTTKELRTLQEHYSKLQDSKYNISDILEWQEYIYPKYKTKLYEKK